MTEACQKSILFIQALPAALALKLLVCRLGEGGNFQPSR